MENKVVKSLQKKSISDKHDKSPKKTQGNKKKKKSKKRLVDVKETGKSSTSPEAEAVLTDNAEDCESDSSTAVKLKHQSNSMVQSIQGSAQEVSHKGTNQIKDSISLCLSKPTNKEKTVSNYVQGSLQKNASHCWAAGSTQSRTIQFMTSSSMSKQKQTVSPVIQKESLRWDRQLADEAAEDERIRIYKLNRRKRYIAASNQSYSEWLSESNTNVNCSSTSSHGVRQMDSKDISTSRSPRVSSSERLITKPSGTGNIHKEKIMDMSGGIKPVKSHSQEIMLNC